MCEYCRGEKNICEFSSPRESNSIYIRGGNKLFCQMGYAYSYMYQKINFCPMCGRNLENKYEVKRVFRNS